MLKKFETPDGKHIWINPVYVVTVGRQERGQVVGTYTSYVTFHTGGGATVYGSADEVSRKLNEYLNPSTSTGQ